MATRAPSTPPGLTPAELRMLAYWKKEVQLSQAAYDEWDATYKPSDLEAYYRGDGQWPIEQRGNYVCNLFYSSIEVRRPSLYFGIPKVRLTAAPNKTDEPESLITARAQLLADSANAQIQNPDFGFMEEISSCIHEHFFRFAISEVGYSADIVDNPNTPKASRGPEDDGEEPEPAEIVASETLWVRRIPGEMFRWSLSGKKRLIDNDWTGYFEWVSLEDVKANPLYKGRTRGLRAKATGVAGSFEVKVPSKFQRLINSNAMTGPNQFGATISGSQNMLLIFKVWDHRKRVRHVFTADFSRCLTPPEGVPWYVYPFSILRGSSEILDSGFPVPPTYNWRGPQDEINERAERQRVHGRRFNRKYVASSQRLVDANEVEKLEIGGDGTVVFVKGEAAGSIVPLADAPLDPRVHDTEAPKTDFIQVSSIGGEQRAVAESETATQANIIDVNSKVRETMQRADVVKFISDTCRVLCNFIREHWTTEQYIRTNVDVEMLRRGSPYSVAEAEKIITLSPTFQKISPADIGGVDDFNYEVSLSMEFLSPGNEDKDREKIMALIAVISNPQTVPVLMASPEIFRRLLRSFGVDAEHDVREWTKMLRSVGQLMAMMAQQQAGGPAPGGGTAGAIGPGPTPDNNAIMDQLAQQGVITPQ